MTDNNKANDAIKGVRLAKEEDRTYISRLLYLTNVFGDETADLPPVHRVDLPRYVENWSPLVDGGVIALSEMGVPAGGAWLRYFTYGPKGAAYMGAHDADPLDESQWATEYDPETIPELCIAVEARYRGTGVGRMLLRNVCDLAAAQEAPAIALWVDANNAPARALYESEGFKDINVPGQDPGPMIKYFA